ncbi:10108_t:CDS:2, partial [Ambispora gerdemannii]
DCPTTFKVAQCTPCQTTVYQLDVRSNPKDDTSSLTCDHLGRFTDFFEDKPGGGEMTAADVENLVADFCKLDNPCPSSVSTVGYQKLQKNCAKEIAGSNNDMMDIALGYFDLYYYAVPDYQNLCLKSSNNSGHEWINVTIAESNYISDKFGNSTQTPTRNVFPPTLKIYYSYENSSNKTDSNTDLPDDIMCSSDLLHIANIYNQYIADNKITDGFSVVTAQVDKLLKKISTTCPNAPTNTTTSPTTNTNVTPAKTPNSISDALK